MAHFVGLDVSVKETSVCVIDDAGKVILEQKILTEKADIIALLTSIGVSFGRIGIEAGPLSQWLVNALTAAELPVICVETRHMRCSREVATRHVSRRSRQRTHQFGIEALVRLSGRVQRWISSGGVSCGRLHRTGDVAYLARSPPFLEVVPLI